MISRIRDLISRFFFFFCFSFSVLWVVLDLSRLINYFLFLKLRWVFEFLRIWFFFVDCFALLPLFVDSTKNFSFSKLAKGQTKARLTFLTQSFCCCGQIEFGIILEKTMSKAKGVDQSARRTWDKELFAKKAEERKKREDEEEEKELPRSKYVSLLRFVFTIKKQKIDAILKNMFSSTNWNKLLFSFYW